MAFPDKPAQDPSLSRRAFLGSSAAAAGTIAFAQGTNAAPAPPNKAVPRPTAPLAMWALTGTLESANVQQQLDAFNEAGWGVVLYPRWGLELEYLGDAWFDRIRFIVEQAASREMEVWLYDEFCWPSGHAKGLVTEEREDLAAQLLEVEPNGESRLVGVPESANLLMPEATQRFLNVTHQRYAEAIGEYFGSCVRAIFTDEPSLAIQHRGRPRGATSWQIRWSSAMESTLGSDFRQRLTEASDVANWRGWRDYWAAYSKVFHESWVAPIAQWCQAHKIAMTGHLLGEGSLGTQVAYNGSLRRQLSAFGIPGIDEISTRTDPLKCEALTLAAIAEYPGQERMVEAYALGPPSMKLDTMRKMVDLCSACGIDRYVMAICPHDLRGGVFKREYLGIHGPQQPWFDRYARIYAEYVAEAAQRARQAKPLGIDWPKDEELWAVAGPDPKRSKELLRMTQSLVVQAREAIVARLAKPPAPVTVTAESPPKDLVWSFSPQGMNSLRVDRPTIVVKDLPSRAELSIQSQLVRGLSINGTAIDLSTAPVDNEFDFSYRRADITKLVEVGENHLSVDLTEAKPLRFLPSLILWGDFAVDMQGQLVNQPKTSPLGDWRQHGYPALCGTGCYRSEVDFTELPTHLSIDTGDYPVRVTLNGKNVGTRSWPPFRFDLQGAAGSGRNDIVVEITSTLGHLFVPAESPPVGLMALRLDF